MDKLKIILDLVRKGQITNEEAEILLERDKEYVGTYPLTYGYWPWYCGTTTTTWPLSYPSTTYCSSGNTALTLTSSSSTTATGINNNEGDHFISSMSFHDGKACTCS